MRAPPIALTALAGMTGAVFILDDPILGGPAIPLAPGVAAGIAAGIGVFTLLKPVVVPGLRHSAMRRHVRPPAAVVST